jgi:hypothetical protein
MEVNQILKSDDPKSSYRDFPRSQAPVVDYFFLGDGIFYIGVK